MLYLAEKRVSYIYKMDKILKLARKSPRLLVFMAENEYKRQVEKVSFRIANGIKKKDIILIAGPSASGKTTTSHLLVESLMKRGISAVVISMDDFFIARDETPELRDGSKDYDNINAINVELLKKCVDELIDNKTTLLPTFDFVNGLRVDNDREIEIKDGKSVIIIEGIHAFNPKILSDKMKDRCVRVLVLAGSDFSTDIGLISHNNLRYCRRLIRDFHTRGSSVAQTELYWRNVRDAEERYITPFVDSADFRIDTVHAYEPILYSSELKEIAAVDKDAEKYLGLLEFDVKLTKEDIGKDAMVWEFLSKEEEE